jgi:integrase/recombinase XerD
MKKAEEKRVPTDYFTREEFEQIVDATFAYADWRGGRDFRYRAERMRALIKLMRWSGLAIRDAVTLEKDKLRPDGKLFLYRAKTGVPVRVPLPADVVQLLQEVPTMNPNFFFWSGNGDPENREERMATGTSSAVQVGESQETRWQPETLPPAHVPRHVRRGIAALGSSN